MRGRVLGSNASDRLPLLQLLILIPSDEGQSGNWHDFSFLAVTGGRLGVGDDLQSAVTGDDRGLSGFGEGRMCSLCFGDGESRKIVSDSK